MSARWQITHTHTRWTNPPTIGMTDNSRSFSIVTHMWGRERYFLVPIGLTLGHNPGSAGVSEFQKLQHCVRDLDGMFANDISTNIEQVSFTQAKLPFFYSPHASELCDAPAQTRVCRRSAGADARLCARTLRRSPSAAGGRWRRRGKGSSPFGSSRCFRCPKSPRLCRRIGRCRSGVRCCPENSRCWTGNSCSRGRETPPPWERSRSQPESCAFEICCEPSVRSAGARLRSTCQNTKAQYSAQMNWARTVLHCLVFCVTCG